MIDSKTIFSCKKCGWKSYPGALVLCDSVKHGPYYCPNCKEILFTSKGEIEMNNDMKKAKEFKDKLTGFIKSTTKTNWGKDQLARLILTLWIEFIEEHVR